MRDLFPSSLFTFSLSPLLSLSLLSSSLLRLSFSLPFPPFFPLFFFSSFFLSLPSPSFPYFFFPSSLFTFSLSPLLSLSLLSSSLLRLSFSLPFTPFLTRFIFACGSQAPKARACHKFCQPSLSPFSGCLLLVVLD